MASPPNSSPAQTGPAKSGQAKSGQALKTGTEVPNSASSNFPPFDTTTFAPQLIWLAITFGFLYLFLSRVALPPIADMISARNDRIKADLTEAERLKTETDTAIANYEKALSDAKAKAGAIAGETRNKLSAEVDKERAAVEAILAKKTLDAEKRINETKTKALSGISDIAADTANAIVSKLTGKEIAIADIKKIIGGSKS
jgi:F-type H+-transporting ATPase subunit b